MGGLSIVGFLTIIIIVLLLISGRLAPIIALVLTPIIAAVIAGFGLEEIGAFFNDGITDVVHVAIMFIFAILFFGIMQDVGLFDPFIRGMITISQGNVIAVSVGSVLIAAVAQLDGSGASTFLITIPALLPLYKKLKMNPYLLLLFIGGSASIMNMLPWAGPLGRSASVLNMDVTELWRPLIPVQVIGLMLMVVLAIILGYREKKRIEKEYGSMETASTMESDLGIVGDTSNRLEKEADSISANNFWINAILAIAVIGTLVWGIIPAGLVFMVGVSIALPLNFPKMEDQMERIRVHAPNALMMATIILAAGTFLGILTGTGMLAAIAEDVVKVIPAFIAPYIHLMIGFFGVPFDLLLSTDAYYFALLPVVEQIATGFGIDSLSTTYAMIVGNIVGTFISPFSPAVWLALGLAGLEMGRHIRYSLFWLWGLSIVLLAITIAIGLITV